MHKKRVCFPQDGTGGEDLVFQISRTKVFSARVANEPLFRGGNLHLISMPGLLIVFTSRRWKGSVFVWRMIILPVSGTFYL